MVGTRPPSMVYREVIFEMKVTLEHLAEKIDSLEAKVESLQEDVNKGKGAVTFLMWLGGVAAIVIGYFWGDK